MSNKRVWLLVFVSAALCGAAVAQTPTTAPAGVPRSALQKLEGLFSRPDLSLSRTEQRDQFIKQMLDVITVGENIEKQYPEAENLYEARRHMLRAAAFLATGDRSGKAHNRLIAVARRIAGSSAAPAEKVEADFYVTLNALRPPGAKPPGENDAETVKAIQAYDARYAETPAAAVGKVHALYLALNTQQRQLVMDLVKELETKYADNEEVRSVLRRLGRSPDVGQPFAAELTKLDGTKVTLPGDLKGKVVVVDFWATWCDPCVAEIPHMRELYGKYKDKNVEFVGISLDRAGQKEELKEFVEQRKMSWIHTYSGMFWNDPTVQKYGVESIPSIWVVGKDGRVVSTNARGALQETIERALRAGA